MPEVVFGPDERDPRFGGVGVMDFYMPNVIQYPHAQDAYFLFSPRYLHYEDWFLSDDLSRYPKSGANTLNTGPEDIGFAASRDGIQWSRYRRQPWIRLGMEGAFDCGNMYPARGMILRGREIWMYYTGYDTLHGDVDVKQQMKPVLSRSRGTPGPRRPADSRICFVGLRPNSHSQHCGSRRHLETRPVQPDRRAGPTRASAV